MLSYVWNPHHKREKSLQIESDGRLVPRLSRVCTSYKKKSNPWVDDMAQKEKPNSKFDPHMARKDRQQEPTPQMCPVPSTWMP